MTSRVVSQAKAKEEVLDVYFNFQLLMPFGDTITAAESSVVLVSGTDLNPNDLLNGAAVIEANYLVKQSIHEGLSGNIYLLQCHAGTAGGLRLTRQSYISILPLDRF